MPLRARIRNPAFAGQAAKISNEALFRELPEDDADDVLFGSIYGVRSIMLNRPKKLNSLNGSMARKIVARLKEWENSQLISCVVMAGAGEKAFCAGGDVAALATLNQEEGREGQAKSSAFFELEYKLDHLIATYSKPLVAYLDGITMGGGVGLSVHAPFRIATEKTVFAMPETTIGFFPDVGGSFFLPRLDGHTGTYLSLTSARLHGVQTYYAGIATHYIDSSNLGDLTARLSELVFKDYTPLPERLALIDATIDEFGSGLPAEPIHLAGDLRVAIDRCFRHARVEDIMEALERESGTTRDWAERTLRTLTERSPTSLKVARRLAYLGREWSLRDAFSNEYSLARRFMSLPDFTEGVTARLIEKPARQPRWRPATLAELGDEDVDALFRREGEERLTFLTDGNYKTYPHEALALPSEMEIRRAVAGGRSRTEVVTRVVAARMGKPGTREKVEEVLERCCVETENDLIWKDAYE